MQADAILSECLIDHSLCPVCPRAGLETIAKSNPEESSDLVPSDPGQTWLEHQQSSMHESSLEAFQAYRTVYSTSCVPVLDQHGQLADESTALLKVR